MTNGLETKKRSAHKNKRTSRAIYEYEKKVRLSMEGALYVESEAERLGQSESDFMRTRIEAGLVTDQISAGVVSAIQSINFFEEISRAFDYKLSSLSAYKAKFEATHAQLSLTTELLVFYLSCESHINCIET